MQQKQELAFLPKRPNPATSSFLSANTSADESTSSTTTGPMESPCRSPMTRSVISTQNSAQLLPFFINEDYF